MAGESVDKLYPSVGAAPTRLCPARWPGADHEVEETLLSTLKENYENWHIFFNDKGFHNHLTHQVLAIYALGAPPPVIRAAYDVNASYLRPAIQPPERINVHNFDTHLGDGKYYGAYRDFFASVLLDKGIPATLEEYIFSTKYNYHPDVTDVEKQPRMLSRFMSGVLHPWIHTGYGVEFDLVGQTAEGLAETAVHEPFYDALVPRSRFAATTSSGLVPNAISRLTSALPSLSLTSDGQSGQTVGQSAFAIVSRLLSDPRCALEAGPRVISNRPEDHEAAIIALMKKSVAQCGEICRKAAEDWLPVEGPEPTEKVLNEKMEEIIWVTVTLYAVCGWSEVKPFNADFFLMHLVTSAIFLPSLLAPSVLPMKSRRLLLHTYFATCLSTWISRGRPGLTVRDFMARTDEHLTPPGPKPEPHTDALPPNDPKIQTNANSWLPIVQTTVVHPDQHLCKVQRALVHFATVYGNRAKGFWKARNTENMNGLEELDGTIFVRAAGLTANRLGWMISGEKIGQWDFNGFYEDRQA